MKFVSEPADATQATELSVLPSEPVREKATCGAGRQSRLSHPRRRRRDAPATGPMQGPTIGPKPKTAMNMPRSFGGAMSPIEPEPMAMTEADPAACMQRRRSSSQYSCVLARPAQAPR